MMYAEHKWQSKPRIKRSGPLWQCSAWGTTGYGETPATAWAQWNVRRLRELAPFRGFPMPGLIPQAAPPEIICQYRN